MKKINQEKILSNTKSIYNAIAGDFSNTRSRWWSGFGDFNKYVRPGDRVLDLGCGNGRMAEIFEGKNISYLGIDNSEELIKIARQRFNGKSWVKFEVGDVLDFIAKEGSFNLILMIAVLHHLPTYELRLKALKNAYDLLKPGGRLVMSNWNLWQINLPLPCLSGRQAPSFVRRGKKNFRYFRYLFNYPAKFKKGVFGFSDALVPWKLLAGNNLRYVHSFGISEMTRLLKQAGFKIEKIGFEAKDGRPATILTGDNLLAIAVKK